MIQSLGKDFLPVWLHDPTTRAGVYHKMSPKWKVPYIITNKINDLLYLVKKSPKQTPKACHIDRPFFRNGSNPTMNKVGGSNCVKVFSTFPCIVYSDVNNCRN
jgi:hypothetical protein